LRLSHSRIPGDFQDGPNPAKERKQQEEKRYQIGKKTTQQQQQQLQQKNGSELPCRCHSNGSVKRTNKERENGTLPSS